MISSKAGFYEYLECDNSFQVPHSLKQKLIFNLCGYPNSYLRRYLYYLRKEEYYINTANGNKFKAYLGMFYEGKKNRLGMKLGIEIGPNSFGKGLQIYHGGTIIVNYGARIGENCKLHGNNCIGNNGKNDAVPRIGNNVDIGFGAVIIGDIDIADNVIIGSNAVINKSILTPGAVVVGVPGREIVRN